MTRKQSEVFTFIKNFIAVNNFSPTYKEIAEHIGVSSLATVHKHVQCLAAEGRVITCNKAKQSIKIVAEPVDDRRFEFEGSDHLWDKKLKCYWVKAG